MRRKIIRLLCMAVLAVLLAWLVISYAQMQRLHNIWRYAEDVMEPSYTLVVNGEIIQHTYTVHWDRYRYDGASGLQEEYYNGDIEIPILTVLTAMGAKCSKEDNGLVLIEYSGEEYYLMPEMKAIYPADAEGSFHTDTSVDTLAPNQQEWGNLLLIWPETSKGYFYEECGEYIVDLSSLHLLALSMDFTFDFDREKGIVYFSSEAASPIGWLPLPGH